MPFALHCWAELIAVLLLADCRSCPCQLSTLYYIDCTKPFVLNIDCWKIEIQEYIWSYFWAIYNSRSKGSKVRFTYQYWIVYFRSNIWYCMEQFHVFFHFLSEIRSLITEEKSYQSKAIERLIFNCRSQSNANRSRKKCKISIDPIDIGLWLTSISFDCFDYHILSISTRMNRAGT